MNTQATTNKTAAQQPLAFALAGEIVTSTQQATRILKAAIDRHQEWLIPQARSVRRQLEAAGAA